MNGESHRKEIKTQQCKIVTVAIFCATFMLLSEEQSYPLRCYNLGGVFEGIAIMIGCFDVILLTNAI